MDESVVVRATAATAELFERQGVAKLAAVVRAARPWVDEHEYDWTGEVTSYQLVLEVSIDLYSDLEADLEDTEAAILAKIRGVLRSRPRDLVDSVVISPTLAPPMTSVEPPLDNAADHIWDAGMFRLFISHVAEHKTAVSILKWHLGILGISGFVAHQDIEPSLEWQGEIELALRTSQAALALLTLDFHASRWTDQEVGIAIARGLLIIPVNIGLVPYGFMGKYQALGGSLEHPEALAESILSVLSRRPSTSMAMREGLVSALERANTFKDAKRVAARLVGTPPDFTEAQKARLRAAIADNDQVANALGVPEKLATITGLVSTPPESVQ